MKMLSCLEVGSDNRLIVNVDHVAFIRPVIGIGKRGCELTMLDGNVCYTHMTFEEFEKLLQLDNNA